MTEEKCRLFLNYRPEVYLLQMALVLLVHLILQSHLGLVIDLSDPSAMDLYGSNDDDARAA